MLSPVFQLGTHPDLPFEVQRRVRMLNGLSLAAIAAALVFTVYDIATRGHLAAYLYVVHGLAIATSGFTLWRHAAGDYHWPRLVSLVGHTVACAGGSVLTGAPQTGRYYLIVIAITTFYMYRSRWAVFAAFLLPALLFAYLDMGMTVVPRDGIRYGIFFGLLYASVAMLTAENRRHLERLEAQRDALARQDQELRSRSEHLSALNEDLETSLDTVSLQLEAIRAQQERLVTLNQLKDRVVSVLSHDLRSPLASLDGLLTAVTDETLTLYEMRVLLPEVQRNLRTTQEQLDDILHWAAALLHDTPADAACADLYTVTTRAVAHASVRGEAKQVRVEARVPRGLTAQADPRHVMVVLRNLMSNAIKYTPREGTVIVTGIEADDHVIVRVQDSGRGMTPEEVASLLSPERRVTSMPGTEGETGSGLGLVLCQEFAERCGGRLDIRSTPGAGTTVSLLMPRAELPPEPARPARRRLQKA
ncbi:MAG TPA: HAMP domain-containing sensor histidine kinase [Rhodothermales bacterium]|nr:HAMP domain-containing sensor histidine kinase [Rhodothermales bacterium]